MQLFIILFCLCLPILANASPANEQCRKHFLYGQYTLAENPCIIAAKEGDLDAQNWLALMYTKGKGVEQDMEKAVYWRTKSAQSGDANSQYHLGRFFQLGEGVARDYPKALYWYRMAALQGDANGQYAMGNLYSKALGVDRNVALAHAWYSLAAEKGMSLARQAMDSLESSMTQDQMTEAMELVGRLGKKMGS